MINPGGGYIPPILKEMMDMLVFDTLSIDYNVVTDAFTISNDYVYASMDTNIKILINRQKYVNCINVTVIARDGSLAFMIYTRTIESKNAQYV